MFSLFQVCLSVVTTAGIGAMSSYLINTTLPDRPEIPENLEVVLTKSRDVKLSWNPPKKKNGPLSSYLVRTKYTNYRNETVTEENFTTEPTLSFENLQVLKYINFSFKHFI